MIKSADSIDLILKGLDIGYSYTKDNTGNIFKSAFSRSNYGIVSSNNQIIIDGETYYVGTGKMTSDADKTNSELNKVCTIMNLVQSGNTDFILSVGLPIGQYDQKDKLKHAIMGYNKSEIIYQGKNIKLDIYDVIVNPQGASAIYSFDNYDNELILIDVGGITIDISLIEKTINGGVNITKRDSLYLGMRTLYPHIIREVNNRYSLKLEDDYAEKILLNGLTVKGEKQDVSFLHPTIVDYVEKITDTLKTTYPTDTVPIYLLGGAAKLLYHPLLKRLKNVKVIDNAQFANAVGYYEIAKLTYKGGVLSA